MILLNDLMSFWHFEKKSIFRTPQNGEKIKNGGFFKKYVSWQHDCLTPRYTLMGPQTPICPISLPHILPCISYILDFEKWYKMRYFVHFDEEFLGMSSYHQYFFMIEKYGPCAFKCRVERISTTFSQVSRKCYINLLKRNVI